MISSFRLRLALRLAAAMALGVAAVSVVSLLALRAVLDQELDANLVNVASIQAASVADSPPDDMHLHEWDLTPEEAEAVGDLVRYVQVWSVDGRSLLRSQYMVEDLPQDTTALRRTAEGDLAWSEDRYQGVDVRSVYYPLERIEPGHERHVIQVAAPLSGRNEMLVRVGIALAGISVLVTLGTFLGGWWLADHVVRPVHAVTRQAEEIEAGSLGRRIEADADTEEYARLVQVLNRMLSRIESAFEAQRRFTADASHELRSPLTAMRGELEVTLRRTRAPEEYRRVLASMLEEVERLSRISEDLLLLARSDAGAIEPRLRRVVLDSVVARVVEKIRPRAAEAAVRIEVASEGSTRGMFDPDLLHRIVWNLVENAVRFTPQGGVVSIALRRASDTVVVTVDDTGPGLGPVDPARVFERFYRADPARTPSPGREGTGLGLAIALAAVEAHGGSIRAENRVDAGARFVVTLPRLP